MSGTFALSILFWHEIPVSKQRRPCSDDAFCSILSPEVIHKYDNKNKKVQIYLNSKIVLQSTCKCTIIYLYSFSPYLAYGQTLGSEASTQGLHWRQKYGNVENLIFDPISQRESKNLIPKRKELNFNLPPIPHGLILYIPVNNF